MSTFGNGYLVDSGISSRAASNGANITLTVAAGKFAIVNVGSDLPSGNLSILMDGFTINGGAGVTTQGFIFYVGPGSTLTANHNTGKATITGCLFKNTN